MSQLGRYTLLRRLAEGGMGSVYLAEIQGAANFTRKVAIKRILPHLARDPAFLSKFIDEANLMVQLHHGNIIGVQELADADGELYIVMDYLPGRDLKAITRALRGASRLMPPDLAVWLIAEVCAGLDYAHRKTDERGEPLRIVHRDVSPSNILLGAGGEVKVADFGIARARGGLHKSVTGALQGKFVYMSPEQAEGRALDARSDVFSTGLILYELLCNTRPFAGESDTEILRLVRAGVTRPPRALRPDLDEPLNAIVMRALERDPEARFESAGALRQALLRYLAEAHSAADANALSLFLREIFPEGVVPESAPPTPLSMDDALLLQLNALTPSGQGTPSAQSNPALAATLSRPAHVDLDRRSRPSPTPTRSASEILSGLLLPEPTGLSGSSSQAAPPRSGGRALLVLGTILSLLLAVGWVLWPKPAQVHFELTPEGLEAPRFSIKEGEQYIQIQPGAVFSSGEVVRLCAEARDHKRRCLRKTLSPGENTFPIDLPLKPFLDPIIEPEGIDADVLIGKNHATTPYFVEHEGKVLTVSVEAKGYITVPPERLWQVGSDQPKFTLIKEPDLGIRDAGVASDAGVAKPDMGVAKPRKHRRSAARIKSTPTSAQITCDGEDLGTTPVTVDTTTRARACRISAKGYAAASLRLRRHQKGRQTITLKRPVLLNIRAEAGAAEIFIDGQRAGTGVVQKHPLSPGRHVIVAKIKGKKIAEEVINPREGDPLKTIFLSQKP